jgi:hypothetical protein
MKDEIWSNMTDPGDDSNSDEAMEDDAVEVEVSDPVLDQSTNLLHSHEPEGMIVDYSIEMKDENGNKVDWFLSRQRKSSNNE